MILLAILVEVGLFAVGAICKSSHRTKIPSESRARKLGSENDRRISLGRVVDAETQFLATRPLGTVLDSKFSLIFGGFLAVVLFLGSLHGYKGGVDRTLLILALAAQGVAVLLYAIQSIHKYIYVSARLREGGLSS